VTQNVTVTKTVTQNVTVTEKALDIADIAIF